MVAVVGFWSRGGMFSCDGFMFSRHIELQTKASTCSVHTILCSTSPYIAFILLRFRM